jgi:exopolysaccharide biosynthesis WecB/TagA/CpsF family protein
MQKILDKKIACGSNFKSTIEKILEQDNCTAISFVNPFSYIEVLKERTLVDGIDYFFSDGALLCKMHSIFHQKIERASFDFSSIADYVLSHLETHNISIAMIGALQPEIESAVKNLKILYPNLNVCFYRNGYINNTTDLVSNLNNFKPQVVLLGMGTPYQERMSISLKNELRDTKLIITCGGFLTQTSIKADYYHPWIKKMGLRWLQRMIMHKHVRSRVLKDYPRFVISYLRNQFKI